MMNVLSRFARKLAGPKPAVLMTVNRNETCFCGAALDIAIPVVMLRSDDDTYWESAAMAERWRTDWHQNHYHQLNPALGDLMGTEVEAVAVEVTPRQGLGFHLG